MYEHAELLPPRRRDREWEQPGKPEVYRTVLEHRVAEAGWHTRFEPIGPVGLVTPTAARTAVDERWWRTYMGMQSLVDRHLGRILDELDTLGFASDTLIIYTSDHGEHMGDHYLWGKSELHYDAGARVPLVARWPDRPRRVLAARASRASSTWRRRSWPPPASSRIPICKASTRGLHGWSLQLAFATVC